MVTFSQIIRQEVLYISILRNISREEYKFYRSPGGEISINILVGGLTRISIVK